ncbi:hypothetical protein XELAEV_18037997mg [Xenopus laevis]|uniref:UBX domain-containing protein n=1 Tax=Xenopus laevis TaxID=8355 RepID=A0A974HAP7_XENLA|nr:hypothetical protein XELAEV_18037997mg [Xenopus laevis]
MALSPTNINIPRSGDPLCRMHLTRPKSAKGRARTNPRDVSHSGAGATDRADDEELARHTSDLTLTSDSEGSQMKALYRYQTQTVEQNQKPQGIFNSSIHDNPQEPSDQETPLLLAIRSHTGQRFERYFQPTDALLTVLAAAEERTGVSCKDCCVESMVVPRRSFPILSWTLQQCGIPNKSVLCIHQMELD